LRCGSVRRTYTGAYHRGDSPRPRSQDFKTALRDLPYSRSTHALRMFRRPLGRIPGSFKYGALGAPFTLSQVTMWPSSRSVACRAIRFWKQL